MKKTIKIISIVLAAAVVIGVAAVAINRLTPSKAEETTTVKQTTTVPQTEEITVDWNGEEFKAVNNDGLINILLVGQDRRPNEGRQRSDAMILCSFNPETNRMSAISFLRDLYVQIPGYDDNRLNAAYAFGGFELIKETFNHNFGITVDGCLESDFEGFEKIIDAVGGVEIELTSEEAEIVGDGASQGTCNLNGVTDGEIARKIGEMFDLRPAKIIEKFQLTNPIFEETAAYGHFGRKPYTKEVEVKQNGQWVKKEVQFFGWEKLDSVEKVKEVFGL